LGEAARREVAAAEGGRTTEPAAAVLVLAYPPSEVARAACTTIRQQLAAIDIAVELKELPPILGRSMPEDVDLLYVELALWEPLVDGPRALGERGLAGGCSALMSESLRRLEQAADWSEAVARLQRIDRVAHDEVAVVPLWQLSDWFACRKSVEGVETTPLTLYHNIERWKLNFEYPSEN